ncbi:MAG: DUF3380 domain-containing protein, partial [Mesorhizobium sp.]|nr:DUF3380 domain-containing protein [Mesorhizobium sp.]
GLAAAKAGQVKNPKSQADRWKMLRRAAEIDISAAYESTSWGVGQVMGANWKDLGYASVDELVRDARRGIGWQVKVMCKFITANKLANTLFTHNWEAFARVYNGPNYAAGGYHTKLAAAYLRYRNLPALPALPLETPKPTEKPVEAQKPVPTTSDTAAQPKTLPAPTPESRRGLFAKLLALIGIGGGGAGAAALSQADAEQLAAWVFFGGLVLLVVVMFVIWRRGRK